MEENVLNVGSVLDFFKSSDLGEEVTASKQGFQGEI